MTKLQIQNKHYTHIYIWLSGNYDKLLLIRRNNPILYEAQLEKIIGNYESKFWLYKFELYSSTTNNYLKLGTNQKYIIMESRSYLEKFSALLMEYPKTEPTKLNLP